MSALLFGTDHVATVRVNVAVSIIADNPGGA
jgi:hypothetical protein